MGQYEKSIYKIERNKKWFPVWRIAEGLLLIGGGWIVVSGLLSLVR